MIEAILKRPHMVISLTLLGCILGIVSYFEMPMNLFPDTNRPVVSVVTKWPGATARDVAREITHPMEVRLSGVNDVRRVTSTSRDQVSAVQLEFEYGTDIETAASSVISELPRVRSELPAGAQDSLVFKITDAARPVMVLSATSAEPRALTLSEVRRLAENKLRDRLLNIPGVSEVEVFGGGTREVLVEVDRDELTAHGVSVELVAAAISKTNVSIPSGLIYQGKRKFLIATQSLTNTPEEISRILVPLAGGTHIRVGDIANVRWAVSDRSSLYRGNGKEAVAVSLLRAEDGHAREVIEAVNKELAAIRAQFSMLSLEVSDTQQRLIEQTVDNLLSALRDAVIMTLIVILLFLGNTRAALITALSIPFTYLLTFLTLRLIGYEFNMITLTAIIIAVGLLADDAIVVIENIERRMRETGESGLKVASEGTSEIFLADMSGTISTVIVLVPIMFIGGYVEKVLQPLTVTLSIALIASLIVSVTIIPLLVPWVLKPSAKDPLRAILEPFEKWILEPLRHWYVSLVTLGLSHPKKIVFLFIVLFAVSLPQMRLLGRELMPLMDTGTMLLRFEAEPDTNESEMRIIAKQVEEVVRAEIDEKSLISISSVVGSEPGVKSFGASRTLQQGELTINIVNRFKRMKGSFEIEQAILKRLKAIPGVISSSVFDFGATPLSSLRAPVDIMLSGPDPKVLDTLAEDVMERLQTVRGLTAIERSWQAQSKRIKIEVDEAKARLYGLTPADVAKKVSLAITGFPGGAVKVEGESPIPILLRFPIEERNSLEELRAIPITGENGEAVPLLSLASFHTDFAPPAVTHQALRPTIDILGYRRNIAVTHLHENIVKALSGLELPRDYSLSYEGGEKQLSESFGRLGVSFAIGLVLLYVMLVITFRSFLDPIAIMACLPLAIIGAAWAMLLANKHGCMPSFMGLILLMGIVVNNGILLIDFTKEALKKGLGLKEALLESVKIRIRPILMTAGASATGMIPIALEWAVGIERLSPLAVVAIGGLVAGTFLTLLAVPVVFYLLESNRQHFRFQ